MPKTRTVSASRLTSEARAHFKETNEVKGPLAPIIVAILSSLLPKLIEWLLSKYDVTPRDA